MAITVADCLKLSILKGATVIGGAEGLHRLVESVTVCEFDGFQIEPISNALVGNELAITAFSFLKNRDVDTFLSFVQNAVVRGLSCFVVFYTGFVLEHIPQEVLSLADKLHLPIITFPTDSPYSYTDLIMAVTEAILSDRRTDTMFISDVIDQMLSMDEKRQNNQTLLQLLSKEVSSSLVLTDKQLTPFMWAFKGEELDLKALMRQVSDTLKMRLPQTPKLIVLTQGASRVHLRMQPIRTDDLIGYLFAVNPADQPFNVDAITQAREVLRLFWRVFRFSSTKMSELNAVLEGGAMTDDALAQIRHIAVIRGKDDMPLKQAADELELTQILHSYNLHEKYAAYRMSYFDGSIVIVGKVPCESLIPDFARAFTILNEFEPLTIGECNVHPGQSVYQIHRAIRQAFPAARKVFPMCQIFTEEKILFVQSLLQLTSNRQGETESHAQLLLPLKSDSEWPRHFETLATLYLDCDGSMSDCAKKLQVHINTIKYRLQKMQKRAHLDMESNITQAHLTTALAIARLCAP